MASKHCGRTCSPHSCSSRSGFSSDVRKQCDPHPPELHHPCQNSLERGAQESCGSRRARFTAASGASVQWTNSEGSGRSRLTGHVELTAKRPKRRCRLVLGADGPRVRRQGANRGVPRSVLSKHCRGDSDSRTSRPCSTPIRLPELGLLSDKRPLGTELVL